MRHSPKRRSPKRRSPTKRRSSAKRSPKMALHTRYPKMEISSSDLLMIPSQGILGSLKNIASKAQTGYNKSLEIKQKAEAAAQKALEKGQQLQAQATALAEKAEKTGKQLQQKAEQIQQQADQVKQQYEQALAAKQEAETQVRILQQQEKASSFQKSVIEAKSKVSNKQTDVAAANIKRAQAQLEAAQLNLTYTVITAAIDGQVSKVDIQPGQLVQAGQSLFQIINNASAWVIANFKETQLNKMVEGQKVTIKVDAYPDYDFQGTIASFSPATGSRFSLLPPDNATGNFVKTIQRFPVKISLDATNDPKKIQLLRPGMNADVDVHLQ
jgi:multidrug resistance efflux pump